MQREHDQLEKALAVFKPEVWKQDGRFVLHQRALAILVSDEVIGEAHAKYVAELESKLQSYQQADLMHLFPGLGDENTNSHSSKLQISGANPSVRKQLGVFTAKLGILTVVLFLVFQIGSGMIANRIELSAREAIKSVTLGLMSEASSVDLNLVSRARGVLQQTAEHLQSLDDEKREALQSDLKVISSTLRPFVDGLIGSQQMSDSAQAPQ